MTLSFILATLDSVGASGGLSVRERAAAWGGRSAEQGTMAPERAVDREIAARRAEAAALSSSRKIAAAAPRCEAAVQEHCKSSTCAQYCTAINAMLPAETKAERIANCLVMCPASCEKGLSRKGDYASSRRSFDARDADPHVQFDILERLNNDRLMQCIAAERGAGGVRLGGDGTPETAHLPANWRLVVTPSYRAVLIRAGMYSPAIEAVDNAGAAHSLESVGMAQDYASDRYAEKANVRDAHTVNPSFRVNQADLDAARARLRRVGRVGE